MNAHLREHLLSDIIHLTLACPHDNSNPPFCPLHEVRKMTREEIIKWIRMLSDEDLQYLATYHQVCLQWRATAA